MRRQCTASELDQPECSGRQVQLLDERVRQCESGLRRMEATRFAAFLRLAVLRRNSHGSGDLCRWNDGDSSLKKFERDQRR